MTEAEEGGTCFTGGSESTVVGRKEAHSRKGPNTALTMLFTFSPTTKIILGRNYWLAKVNGLLITEQVFRMNCN